MWKAKRSIAYRESTVAHCLVCLRLICPPFSVSVSADGETVGSLRDLTVGSSDAIPVGEWTEIAGPFSGTLASISIVNGPSSKVFFLDEISVFGEPGADLPNSSGKKEKGRWVDGAQASGSVAEVFAAIKAHLWG